MSETHQRSTTENWLQEQRATEQENSQHQLLKQQSQFDGKQYENDALGEDSDKYVLSITN